MVKYKGGGGRARGQGWRERGGIGRGRREGERGEEGKMSPYHKGERCPDHKGVQIIKVSRSKRCPDHKGICLPISGGTTAVLLTTSISFNLLSFFSIVF